MLFLISILFSLEKIVSKFKLSLDFNSSLNYVGGTYFG